MAPAAPEAPAPPGARRSRRRGPGVLAHVPYVLIVCGVAAGLTLISLHYYRRGSALLAVAALAGALVRLTLPDERAGLLATRKRATDVLIMVSFAIGIAVVAWVLHTPK